jgi:hypothetical protein
VRLNGRERSGKDLFKTAENRFITRCYFTAHAAQAEFMLGGRFPALEERADFMVAWS